MSTVGATPEFSPSELVLLHGEEFATAEKGLSAINVELLHSKAKVSTDQLGQAMLTVAFLANQQAGTIRLEIRDRKERKLFGLRQVTTKALFADPGSASAEWPADSLEAQVRSLVEKYEADKERRYVSNLVYQLLGVDDENPCGLMIDFAKKVLKNRGLLETVKEKRLVVFTEERLALRERTAALAAQQPVAPLRQLLAEVETKQTELWKLLLAEIRHGVGRRYKVSQPSYGPSSY